MTKYVIVFLLKGKARAYQLGLTSELSNKFKIKNVSKVISPHITLKYLNLITSKKKLEELIFFLKEFSKNEKRVKTKLSGVGNFRKDVIFIDVEKSKQFLEFYDRLYRGLTSISWMPLIKSQEGKNMHFHVTLATRDIKSKFTKIFKYLSDRNPNYEISIDRIDILKKRGQKWEKYKTFKLK